MEDQLLKRIAEGAAPHALLIAGSAGSGKRALARRAAALYCLGNDDPSGLSKCPNYDELTGSATNIERVRTLMAAVAARSFNDARRAYVILDAHRMEPRTQNALLKVLEEPPADTLLILTGSEMGLLPTVRSRCMIRRIGALPVDEVERRLALDGIAREDAHTAAAAADGVEGLARYYASEAGAAFRSGAIRLLEQALFAASPFAAAAELTAEDAPKEGKKKRQDGDKVTRLFFVWLDVLRDALLAPYGMPARNLDAAALIKRISARFTEKEIQGIIETLTTAQQRLYFRASPALSLDTALAKLCIKEKA